MVILLLAAFFMVVISVGICTVIYPSERGIWQDDFIYHFQHVYIYLQKFNGDPDPIGVGSSGEATGLVARWECGKDGEPVRVRRWSRGALDSLQGSSPARLLKRNGWKGVLPLDLGGLTISDCYPFPQHQSTS